MSTSSAVVPRLEIRHAGKTFGHTRVLDDVSLQVAPGSIHALIGQNGSGKSTLLKLLSGFHRSDPGSAFLVDGVLVGPPISPGRLRAAGAAFVHQDLGLNATSSVADNVRVGRYGRNRLTRNISTAAEHAVVRDTLAGLGSDIDPATLVGRLAPNERSLVAIARAVQDATPGQGLIMFDESTQSMPKSTLGDFYALMRTLASAGTSILLVTHRLDEVMNLCDRATVLRDGRVAADVEIATTSEAELTRLMLGQDPERLAADASSHRTERVVLAARAVAGGDVVAADLDLHSGEIVGVVGLPQSGYEDVPYLLSGAMPATHGQITLNGTAYTLSKCTSAQLTAAGIALVPGSRAEQGLALELTALENLTVPRLTRRSTAWHLSSGWQREEYTEMAHQLGITPPRPEIAAAALSGGNQQKLLLAKWLLDKPEVLLLHEPTQAVDVGARRDILHALRKTAESGTAVLISSVEPDDLASICDRVLVVEAGRVTTVLSAPLEANAILEALYPARAQTLAMSS